MLRLAQVKNIVGIKEATSNIERVTDLMKRMPKGFLVFSGNDDAALAYILLGAHGVISVTANVAPRLMHEMCAAALAGETAQGHRHQQPAARPAQEPVRRIQSHPGEVGARTAWAGSPRASACRSRRLRTAYHETVAGALREAGCLD